MLEKEFYSLFDLVLIWGHTFEGMHMPYGIGALVFTAESGAKQTPHWPAHL